LLGHEAAGRRRSSPTDGTGRHTTTAGSSSASGGALLVDTPGLREVQLWDATRDRPAFADVDELAARLPTSTTAPQAGARLRVQEAIDEAGSRASGCRAIARSSASCRRLAMKQDPACRSEEKKKRRRVREEPPQERW
jgi:ribosome biogenesis GTPase